MDTQTTEIYTYLHPLSRQDALPISQVALHIAGQMNFHSPGRRAALAVRRQSAQLAIVERTMRHIGETDAGIAHAVHRVHRDHVGTGPDLNIGRKERGVEMGRGPGRERGGQYVWNSVVAYRLQKIKNN